MARTTEAGGSVTLVTITAGEGGETRAVLWLGYDGSGLGARLGAGE